MDNTNNLTDGLGNSIYDAEASQKRALGSFDVSERRFVSKSGGTNFDRPIAIRQGAGFPNLITDVWEQVFPDDNGIPAYIRLKQAGESVEFDRISEWDIKII